MRTFQHITIEAASKVKIEAVRGGLTILVYQDHGFSWEYISIEIPNLTELELVDEIPLEEQTLQAPDPGG